MILKELVTNLARQSGKRLPAGQNRIFHCELAVAVFYVKADAPTIPVLGSLGRTLDAEDLKIRFVCALDLKPIDATLQLRIVRRQHYVGAYRG